MNISHLLRIARSQFCCLMQEANDSISLIGYNSHGFYGCSGGGQNFERRNVERLKFQNFKVANIKITKNDLFDSFIIEFIF